MTRTRSPARSSLTLCTAALLLGALSACSKEFDKTDGELGGADGPGGDGGDGGSGGDGGDASGLPDLLATADRSGCQTVTSSDGEELPVPGAVSYFYGVYAESGDEDGVWVGTERWVLFANDRWQELGEGDCEVVWLTRATEAEGGGCGTCDLNLSVEASLDGVATTCPEGLYEGEEQWSGSYGVIRRDGQSEWYFSSGTRMGSGGATDSAVNFLTDKTCTWF